MEKTPDPTEPLQEALRSAQRLYLLEKRLAASLLGLLNTLQSDPHPDHVTNIALLTLVGQLVVRCAAYLRMGPDGIFRLTTLYGGHDAALTGLILPDTSPVVISLFHQQRVLDLDPAEANVEPALWALRHAGLRYLYPITEIDMGRGIIALGEKFSGEPLDPHDAQVVSAVGVAITVSWRAHGNGPARVEVHA
jgi:hypothetical protein